MACNIPTYENIKGMIVGQNISVQTLDILKQDFAEEISSKRRLACVNCLGDLLDVLERKDVINAANISPLEDICYFLRNKELIDAISHYKSEEEYDFENEYALENIQHEIQEKMLVEERKNGPTPPNAPSGTKLEESVKDSVPAEIILSGKKRDEVYDLISKEISREWRTFGREIGIEANEMYDLETHYRGNSREKIRRMLEIFEEDKKVAPTKMVSCICAALVQCRRSDLCRDIQAIMKR